MDAARNGDRDTVQYLCENGADIHAKDNVSENSTVIYVHVHYIHYICIVYNTVLYVIVMPIISFYSMDTQH